MDAFQFGKASARLAAPLRLVASTAALVTSCLIFPALAAENVTPVPGREPGAGQGTAPIISKGEARQQSSENLLRRADFDRESASAEAVGLADWIVDSRNNQGMPFMIVDKVQARVFVFHADGQLRGAAAALLGLARGDDSTPGIGAREISAISPAERTTPAGRFVASLDRDTRGVEMLWVDYDAAIALHRVVPGTPAEKRAYRLESATAADNRISYGCINVPEKFFDQVVSPAFTGTNGIVYVLPETRSAREVFGSYDVNKAPSRQDTTPTRPSLALSKSHPARL